MPKFRKKPVVINAFQWTGNWEEFTKWLVSLGEDVSENSDGPAMWRNADASLTIDTLEGDMRGDLNDWIIRGVNGEYYPCKPDIFEKTYDAEIELPLKQNVDSPIDWDKRDALYGR